jgi:hypothetical protein
MTQLNANLHTYKATVHLEVAMKSFPFLSPSLDGAVYYKQPDKTAVVFDTVPALAGQFKKVYPRLDPPSTWLAIYDVTVMSDDGTVTTFRLIPKKNGRVEHLDLQRRRFRGVRSELSDDRRQLPRATADRPRRSACV